VEVGPAWRTHFSSCETETFVNLVGENIINRARISSF